MPLAEGTTFAGYTIVRLLGSGGMGEVYLAQHPRLPRRDALKLLPIEWSADPDYRARFNREADLASTLWHPHIVGVHDRGEYNGQLWISMDFVDGQDLSRLLTDKYPAGMPTEQVVRIIAAVGGALDYAHKQGLLHRDVKPANIMLTNSADDGEQRILLTDFGIARDLDEISGLTETNMTVGTVAYSAPEQLKGERVDGRADQYALAATAYQLLTGAQLFPHTRPVAVISAHLTSAPPSLARHRADLAPLDPVFGVALAKNADDRFARCSDFARALADQSQTLKSVSNSARTAQRPRSEATQPADRGPTARAASSVPVIAATIAIAIAVVVTATVFVWRPWSAAEPRDQATDTNRSETTTARTLVPTPVTTSSPPPAPPPVLPDAMPTNSGCRGTVLGRTDLQHKYLGTVRLYLSVTEAGGLQQDGCIAAVTGSGRILPAVRILTSNNFFGFPSPPTDATGKTFINYNPGRFDGVAVLIPTEEGFEDIGLDYTEYSGRLAYYYAEVIGPDANGEFVIRKWQQNCTPSCAEGTPTSEDLHWNGRDYVP